MELASRRLADTVVLSPTGRIDHASAEGFRAALTPHLAGCADGQDRVVLDLGAVEYVSSAGLRVLMLAAKQARSQGGTLVVAALAPLVREVFDISRFSLVFPIYPTVRDALAAVSTAALVGWEPP
jgi:anti-anti-sigma factor